MIRTGLAETCMTYALLISIAEGFDLNFGMFLHRCDKFHNDVAHSNQDSAGEFNPQSSLDDPQREPENEFPSLLAEPKMTYFNHRSSRFGRFPDRPRKRSYSRSPRRSNEIRDDQKPKRRRSPENVICVIAA